ncbi:hypothetical protein M405DRAFT_900046 [Rhizopogon salebrosus TDB-379]|nr:hypothetical protein M405DRAFT_900046 [Rhizopogon salebrosus TDB-379]
MRTLAKKSTEWKAPPTAAFKHQKPKIQLADIPELAKTTTASMGPVTVVKGEALWRCLDHAGRDGDVCAQEASTLVSQSTPGKLISAMHLTLNMRVPGAGGRPFQAMHLSWYNRHCTSGHDAPTEVQPWLSISESECFCEPYIICIRQMENYLQEEFEMLMEVVSVLPGNAVLPHYPIPGSLGDKLDKEKGCAIQSLEAWVTQFLTAIGDQFKREYENSLDSPWALPPGPKPQSTHSCWL